MSVQYLITHSGSFHADEVCAAVILSRVFPNASVVRTRDERAIEDAASVSVIFDVGRAYDPQKNRFDHHMRGARAREDGTVYSSFGLIWDHFGREYLRAVGVEDEDVEAVWTRFDSEFVLPVDQIDTGTLSPSKIGVAGGITISALIATMNPPFDESTPKSQGAAFNLAMELAQAAVRARVTALAADVRADKGVEAAIRANGDVPVLVLPYSLDAQPTIDRLGARHVLAIVTPSSSGGWGVTVARTSANSYENVIDMPDAWAGLSGPELEAVSGVPGATFCHSAKFYAAADTKEAALEMARITVESALDNSPSP